MSEPFYDPFDRPDECTREEFEAAMAPKDDGGPAFPQPQGTDAHGSPYSAREVESDSGMSLRDWMAGMALQGLCMNPPTETEALTDCASLAYNIADAMLIARKEASK